MADINDLNNPNEENERKDEFDADNFGLPNVNFDNNEDQGSTFESDPPQNEFFSHYQEETPEEEPEEEFSFAENQDFTSDFDIDEEEEESNKKTWIWISVILVLLIGGGVMFWLLSGEEEPVVAEKPKVEETKPVQPEPEPEPVVEEPEPLEANVDNDGVSGIERLTSLSGNFHVVVKSFLDGDLALDFAKSLEAEGKMVYLFRSPKKNGISYHRVSLGKYATEEEANEELDLYKSNFGEDVWIKKF
ncbi:SPOR domain-containing protein [Persicobacter diffluens]|uniref:SPOR domain-containing protein n=1 Tax=Persicobacter diffluens TaxID=981 RepID=A0AAN4VYQ0_9BACT|nr:hypothetical protein PEDI_13520 [Persicobacter diffluens]